MKTIYIAGPMGSGVRNHGNETGWRRIFFEDDTNLFLPDECHEYPILEDVIRMPGLPNMNYSGPYYVDNTGGHGSHPYENAHSFHEQGDAPPRVIPQLSLRAISKSDLVFAWIDSPKTYGTLLEIGYAAGFGIPVYAYSPLMAAFARERKTGAEYIPTHDDGSFDMWFIFEYFNIKYAFSPFDALMKLREELV